MSNNNWKIQSLPFNDDIKDALMQQHHAAQFIAKVGRHLVPQKDDDSNTNMEFIPEDNLLLGNVMPNGMSVALQLSDLKLFIVDEAKNIRKTICLDGKTQEMIFVELAQNLADIGIDVTNFKDELHYEIPFHELDNGAVFSIKDNEALVENAKYRHNAKLVLNEVSKLLDQDELIRIWPHHFDTGAFYVISKNENGEATKTIGIGFAIPDSMVEEPYYYLSFWSDKPIENLNKFNQFSAGSWMMPDWNGAVLRHSELQKANSASDQYDMVKSFYTDGINALLKILNN